MGALPPNPRAEGSGRAPRAALRSALGGCRVAVPRMSTALPQQASYGVVGRYAVFDEIAAGGMATVHLGKVAGAGGFSRVVAIKRLHPQFAKDAEFAAMFMDEARLAARIHHPNVVQTLDVVTVDAELLLVMEYVHGVPLSALLHAARKAKQRIEPRILAGILAGALEGLHAAHEAKSGLGAPLGVVHRDVSPQNILVGLEGVPRILDFGVAKALGKLHATRDGQLKGKLAYMSPEQVRGGDDVTRQSDVFSASIVLWEALMGERLFDGNNPAELLMQVMNDPIASPRSRFPDLPAALDAVVMKGLSRDRALRYATAREMALELEAAVELAPAREIGRWVEALAGTALADRSELLERIERAQAGAPEERIRVPGLETSWIQNDPTVDESGGESGVSGTRSVGFPVFQGLSATPSPLPPASYPPHPLAATLPALPASAPPSAPPSAKPPASPLQPPAEPPPAARPYRIPVRTAGALDAERTLRERLEAPLRVVALGVVLSVVDVAVRPFTASLPFRPLWIAEILVVAGVLWALARVVLPAPRD